MTPVPLPSASARACGGAGLGEPEQKSVRSESKERDHTRTSPGAAGHGLSGRVLPEPPPSSPSPSLGSSGWGRIRVCKERCDSEGQRGAESDSARPPRLPAPLTSRRAALSHREHRVRHRARRERRGREEVPLRPRRSCLTRGPGQPHPGRAASLGRLPALPAGRAPPAASRLPPPPLPCPGRGALELCLLAIEPLKRKITFAGRQPPAGAQEPSG